jgi:purine-nucleoside phosphorylase
MTIETYVQQVREAKTFLLDHVPFEVTKAVILGTGLAGFEDILEDAIEIPYADIPNYPLSTAPSHKGKLIAGQLHGKGVICLSGRLHYYEGYSMKELTFPIRLMGMLGIKELIISNASGGTNEDFNAGDFVFIRDHINLFPDNPLRGANYDPWGDRFPDMSQAYSVNGLRKAQQVCNKLGIPFKTGVYVGFPGPNLETRSEYQFLHRIGGDLVGMSTVPEVIVARHMSIDVVGISLVTNECYPPSHVKETTLEDVVAMARSKNDIFIRLVAGIIE